MTHASRWPRIDVLLPVRGARRTLPSALGDLLAQRGVNVRVIAVVDALRRNAAAGRAAPDGDAEDGIDASLAWLQQRARREPRLRVLAGLGRGPGAALDLALAAVRTECFAHMEADDRCAPDRLARLHAALNPHDAHRERAPTSSAAPSARTSASPPVPLAAVVSRASQFGARTPGMRRYLDWQNSLLTHADMAAARFLEIPALHQTGLYRTAAVRAVGGFAPRGAWPLDIDFWLRWFEHDALRAPLPVLKLPRVLYRWRQHALQSTRAGAASGGSHALDALRACKVHYIARLLGRRGAAPRPVLLMSTGRTLLAWHEALVASDVEFIGAMEWRPGQPLPPALHDAPRIAARPAAGTGSGPATLASVRPSPAPMAATSVPLLTTPAPLLLAVYGMQPARARLAAALTAAGLCPDGPDVLWAA